MDRSRQLGATLLEIMLVLAIAAMIIVMSIRYYQSASSAQQANTVLSQIQAIIAASDSLAQGSDYTAATTSSVANVLGGANKLMSPWGTISLVPSSTTNVMSIPSVPVSVCTVLVQQIKQNPRLTTAAGCSAVASMSITYNSAS